MGTCEEHENRFGPGSVRCVDIDRMVKAAEDLPDHQYLGKGVRNVMSLKKKFFTPAPLNTEKQHFLCISTPEHL